jgi:hypothetical protein
MLNRSNPSHPRLHHPNLTIQPRRGFHNLSQGFSPNAFSPMQILHNPSRVFTIFCPYVLAY